MSSDFRREKHFRGNGVDFVHHTEFFDRRPTWPLLWTEDRAQPGPLQADLALGALSLTGNPLKTRRVSLLR